MSAVPITLVGAVITPAGPIPTQFVGYAYITGLGVGGGPAQPPLGIWGGGGVGNYPDAGFPGPQPGGPVKPWGPIEYPDQGLPQPQPIPVPPGENVPPPGSPPQIVSGAQPTQPIEPPPAIIVDYPGIGKVIVPKPTETAPPLEGGQAQQQRKPK